MRDRDPYVIGRCGSYLAPTIAHVDHHLRHLRLRLRLTCDLTARQQAATRHDLDALLDRRLRLTQTATDRNRPAVTRPYLS